MFCGWAMLLITAALGLPMLRDTDRRACRIAPQENDRYVVVAFLGTECPLANLYAPRLAELADAYRTNGVRFLAIDSNPQDSLADVRAFATKHRLPFSIAKDIGTTVADRLGARRTPEVIVLDGPGRVRYRGRIDDQYLVGVHRGEPTSHDLRRALDELLAGLPVSVPVTEAPGCLISRDAAPSAAAPITYYEHIAPLVGRRCLACHRQGGSGPMAFDRYDEVIGWSAMIDEVVAAGRMPPWHADPQFGTFANDPSLTADEKAALRQWIADGCPRGWLGQSEAMPQVASSRGFADSAPATPRADGWAIGTPDVIVSMPHAFTVPATGLVEYQYFTVDPGFTEDQWISALEIRPSNARVVHHVNVFLCPPGSSDVGMAGELGSVCLAAMAAGTRPTILPAGMAKKIPAGWQVRFVMHYTTVGTEQTDRTQLGLRLIDGGQVSREVATRAMIDFELNIPPGAAEHRVEHTATVERDLLLLAMFPHMHLRGRSFTYEAAYPDGRRETLLHVPRWDFNWQHRYELAEPKLLPAGTVLRAVAVYDNSAANPANPDPAAWVYTGERSHDEMFNAYYDVAAAEGAAPASWLHWLWEPILTFVMISTIIVLRRCARMRAGR
ncbi:MAG TPA: redoxin domain-containing protein [Pirellulales bacterium]|jgi:thiol-disulfide isomerase/thioredoxin|nr:redoxin domain-containing protein [Pirellulales bacterium]